MSSWLQSMIDVIQEIQKLQSMYVNLSSWYAFHFQSSKSQNLHHLPNQWLPHHHNHHHYQSHHLHPHSANNNLIKLTVIVINYSLSSSLLLLYKEITVTHSLNSIIVTSKLVSKTYHPKSSLTN